MSTEPSAPKRFEIDDVRTLAQLMKEFELGELELAHASGERLRLIRDRHAAAGLAAGAGGGSGRGSAPGSATPIPGFGAGGAGIASHTGGAAGLPGHANTASTLPQNPNHVAVTAPLVGTFYRAASPDSPPFIEVGQRVRKGQALCIIEAMKLMNELESEVTGTVVACLVDNGQPVEYGQVLFHIQKS